MLAHGQVRGDARDLEHRAPPNAHFGRSGCQAEYARRALLHPQASEKEADGGGLAGAVGTEHPQHLAPPDFQIELVQRDHRPVPVRHARETSEGMVLCWPSLHGGNVRGCGRGRFGCVAGAWQQSDWTGPARAGVQWIRGCAGLAQSQIVFLASSRKRFRGGLAQLPAPTHLNQHPDVLSTVSRPRQPGIILLRLVHALAFQVGKPCLDIPRGDENGHSLGR